MMIKLYNTLSRKKERFKPLKKGQVGIYSCGPTVYWHQHIGNMRSYVFSDVLRKMLEFNGLKVKQVVNVTDVGHLTNDSDDGDDKIELAAKKEGMSAKEISDFYLKEVKLDFKKLNIEDPWKWTKATEHIKEQIDLIKILEKKKYTYETNDGIYFNSSKFKNYGNLVGLKKESIQAGKRIKIGNKKNSMDFALWKFSREKENRQQEWNSPWGTGFPGWHIECSAMSMKYLGKSFDIHTGGEDNKLPHHTNEIAQSEAVTGKKFVNYWMHGSWLLNKNGKKVSKSKGGLYSISELEKMGYSALAFRYLCLQVHYRKQMKFSLDALDAAQQGYDRIVRKVSDLRRMKHKGVDFSKKYDSKFLKAISDDLNMTVALKVFWDLLENKDFDSVKKLKLLEKFDEVLGLGIKNMKEEKVKISKEIMELIEKREILRDARKFVEADIVREKIRKKGFRIEDSEEGRIIREI